MNCAIFARLWLHLNSAFSGKLFHQLRRLSRPFAHRELKWQLDVRALRPQTVFCTHLFATYLAACTMEVAIRKHAHTGQIWLAGLCPMKILISGADSIF